MIADNRLIELHEQYKNDPEKWVSISKETGISKERLRSQYRYLRKKGIVKEQPKNNQPVILDNSRQKDVINITENNISLSINDNHPLSIDEIYERFKLHTTQEINLSEYQVHSFKVESWDVTAWADGVPQKVRNYLTDVRFRKKKQELIDYETDKKQLLELCKNYAPKNSRVMVSDDKEAKLLELGIYDPHYGKLSVIDMTGETATLKGASTMVKNAIVDIVERVKNYKIDKILFPIGNDWSHINNSQGTTFNGTQMEYTNYLFQVRRQCKEDLTWAIDYLLKIAPVEIIQVPGNHDEDVILTIAEILDAYFHNNKNVKVDTSPKLRKSCLYGNTYIGFTHGDSRDIKVDRLPLVFASEEREKWAKAKYHEIHLGHMHFKKEQTFILADEFNGVRVRWIPSLASADSWHYRHGFVKSRKTAEAFIWDKECGFIGNFSVNVRMK
jgi:hypothetical protein